MNPISQKALTHRFGMAPPLIALALAAACAAIAAGSGSNPDPKVASPREQPANPRHRRSPNAGEFEAPVPQDQETNLITLNRLSGVNTVANRDSVDARQRNYVVAPHAFNGLVPKWKVNGIFEVAPKGGQVWPPDMAGIGPFYLLQAGSNYFLLTPANFAKVYGPITNAAEVLPYLRVHQMLFGDRFGTIVTEAFKARRSRDEQPPEVTKVEEVKGGFKVRLVIYHGVHRRAFYAETVKLRRNGSVKAGQPKLLKDLGRGIVF